MAKPPSTYDPMLLDRPALPSPRLEWWLHRIVWEDWRPNRRLSQLGRDGAAEWFGITTWEYCNVLFPVMEWQRDRDAGFPVRSVQREAYLTGRVRDSEAENARLRRAVDALGALAEHATRRETELEAALRALTAEDPAEDLGSIGELTCVYCRRGAWVTAPIEHAEACPVARARALLAPKGGA
jgi:hypothetical protein